MNNYDIVHLYDELIFSKNNQNMFRMIPIIVKDNKICKENNSSQYIVMNENNYKKYAKKLYQESYSYYKYIRYNMKNFREYTEEVFQDIAYRTEHENTHDYGVDDEFTYAYIIAHTEPVNHKYLRFYNWAQNGVSRGFIDFGVNWKTKLNLPEEVRETEYYKIPTCIGDSKSDTGDWHIFPVIYKIENNQQQTLIFHDNLSKASEKYNFPTGITIKELKPQKTKNNKSSCYFLKTKQEQYTACAFATVEFFKQANHEIENFNKTTEQLQDKLNQIQKNAQQQVKINRQQNKQSVKGISDNIFTKNKNKSGGFNIKSLQRNTHLHPNQPHQNNIIKEIKLRQQTAEESSVEKYRKAREKRDIERKNSIYYYGK